MNTYFYLFSRRVLFFFCSKDDHFWTKTIHFYSNSIDLFTDFRHGTGSSRSPHATVVICWLARNMASLSTIRGWYPLVVQEKTMENHHEIFTCERNPLTFCIIDPALKMGYSTKNQSLKISALVTPWSRLVPLPFGTSLSMRSYKKNTCQQSDSEFQGYSEVMMIPKLLSDQVD